MNIHLEVFTSANILMHRTRVSSFRKKEAIDMKQYLPKSIRHRNVLNESVFPKFHTYQVKADPIFIDRFFSIQDDYYSKKIDLVFLDNKDKELKQYRLENIYVSEIDEMNRTVDFIHEQDLSNIMEALMHNRLHSINLNEKMPVRLSRFASLLLGDE
jgi:hypothetical protein